MKSIIFTTLATAALLALAACAPASVSNNSPTSAAQATATTAIGAIPTLGATETAPAAAPTTATSPASAPTLEATPTTAETESATANATSSSTEPTSAATSAATSEATTAATAAATSVAAPTPAQTITMVGTEFNFDPNQITLKVGQRVRIEFQNKGTVDHELEVENLPAENVVLDLSQAGNIPDDQRKEAMDNAADGEVHPYAAAGGTATIDFTPTTAGTYDFACNLPGHKEQGMSGTIVVQP